MKPEKAIEILEEVKELDDTMYAYNPAYMNALDMAIEALKEIQLYKDNKLCLIPEDVYSRQCSELDAYKEIGTVEECREAKRFKEYFDELYGIGLEVANWHQNGNTEPFDNFYDAAIDWSEQNERDM